LPEGHTGTTTDGVTGKKHKYSRNATKVNTPEDYVKAEDHLKNSNEFKNKV
jgi:GTP:adenosylcobinamide-phosphate guanylyltransferase